MAEISFCHECGEEVASDHSYCPKCGTDLSSGKGKAPKQEPREETSFGNAEEDFYSEKTPSEKAYDTPPKEARSILYEDDEEVEDILGRSYLDNVIGDGNASRGVMILSSKRVYQKGKRYSIENGDWKANKGSKVVSVNDVTGTSFTSSTEYRKIAGYSVATTIPFMIVSPFLFPIIGGIAFYVYKKFLTKKLFAVEYAGGAIGVDIGWYDDEEVEDFRRKLFVNR